jgi:hypothetical protein
MARPGQTGGKSPVPAQKCKSLRSPVPEIRPHGATHKDELTERKVNNCFEQFARIWQPQSQAVPQAGIYYLGGKMQDQLTPGPLSAAASAG